MIVKVQISLNKGPKGILVYNQDRSVCHQFDGDAPEMKEFVQGPPKRYFRAAIDGDIICLLEQVPDQDW